jgi:hypothetical protein
MKRACLLIVVPALLVALGFAQTPAASSNTDPTSIKGCLGGSDSNYTLVEDNTGHNFKITTSSVDLKPHLGHDVALIGQKASGTATSGAADNGFAVTSLNMISDHCAAAAAAPAGSISTPADTAIPPPAAAAVPAATIPTPADTSSAPAAASAAPSATTVTTPPAEPAAAPTAAAPAQAATVPAPPETANAPASAAITSKATAPAEPAVTPTVAAPVAAVPTPAETASAPAAAATTSDATTPPETVVTPKAAAAHRNRMPADHPTASATPAAAAPSAETATPVADAAKLPATNSAPSETTSTPDAAPATPAVTAKKGSSWLWISIAVVVLIMGTLVPLINRWRKRRLLVQSDAQNLSFSHRASSDPGNSDKPVARKAA